MNKKSISGGRRIWSLIVLFAVVGAFAMLLVGNGLKTRYCYYSWEKEQCDILSNNKGNGLAPLPERNTRYPQLVNLGKMDRPFLVRKLTQLMNTKFPGDEYYLCELQRYVAFAIADASGWDRQEMQEQAEEKNMDVEHYVLWRETTK